MGRDTDGELVLLESIQFNHGGKERVLGILETPHRGMLRAWVDVLNFSKRVGWHNESEYRIDIKKLLGDMFRRNLGLDERDSLCSMGVELDLTLEELPSSEWNPYTVFALGCVRPQDHRIHRKLADLLVSREKRLIKAALWALGEMGAGDPGIQGKIVELLGSGSRLVRARAGRALVKMNPQNPVVYQSIVNLLKNPLRRSEMSWILEKIRPGSPGGYGPLLELLKESDGGVRSVVSWILEQQRPENLEFRRDLVKLLEHPSREVCTTVSILLNKLKPHGARIDGLIRELLEKKREKLCGSVLLLVKRKN